MSIFSLRAKSLVAVGSLAVLLAGGSLFAGILAGLWGVRETASPTAVAYGARGAAKVRSAYTEWVKGHEAYGGDRNVVIPIGYWKALSTAFTRASGTAKLDLLDGSVSVVVSGLAQGEQWDVWLVHNRPGSGASIKPQPSDAMIRAGRLLRQGDTVRLDAELGRAAFAEFHVDLVVVAPAGGDPGRTGLLFGAPSSFQRLYTSLRSVKLLRASDFAALPGIVVKRPLSSLLDVSSAEADSDIVVNEDVVISALVKKGADLFINETFNGNGRTCASCHPLSNNTTIDVNFIANLPDDDPLFVAEFTPALAFNPMEPKFEVPVLMRKAALIVENVDGADDLKNRFTMRGVPHTLGLRTSITPSALDGTTMPPNQRTGWSGDGAPGTGTLKEFATGAVTQHFTRTLTREPGVDFRLPTNAELDAMEAFQLSLGRQVELALPLKLTDARAARGQELFMTPAPAGGSCNVCHLNAGANAAFGDRKNFNFNTGVENQPDRPAELILRALNVDLTPGITTNIIPRDGGFGRASGEGPDGSGFGNGTFNTASLVEAAGTPPFFHDNSIDTIEGAVSFYNSRSFGNSPSGPLARISLEATQVEAIAAFLRVINALDHIREATESATAGKTFGLRDPRAAAQLLRQAIGDAGHAIDVLAPRGLHPEAVKSLEKAMDSFQRASITIGPVVVIDRSQIDKGLGFLAVARTAIVQ
jgi:cytochrome c peroxidase